MRSLSIIVFSLKKESSLTSSKSANLGDVIDLSSGSGWVFLDAIYFIIRWRMMTANAAVKPRMMTPLAIRRTSNTVWSTVTGGVSVDSIFNIVTDRTATLLLLAADTSVACNDNDKVQKCWYCEISILKLVTLRLLKLSVSLSLSLCAYYLGWMSCLISFVHCHSSCEKQGTSEILQKNLVHGRIRTTNTARPPEYKSTVITTRPQLAWYEMELNVHKIYIKD